MDKGLEKAKELDRQEQAAKKRATAKRGAKKSTAKKSAKKSAAKARRAPSSPKRRVARGPKTQVLKLTPDLEITMKTGKYKLVPVRDEDHPPKRSVLKRSAPKRRAKKGARFPFQTKSKKKARTKKRRKQS